MALIDCTYDGNTKCGEVAYIANLTTRSVQIEVEYPNAAGVWYTMGSFGPKSTFQQGAASFSMPGDTRVRAVLLDSQGQRTTSIASLGVVLPGTENIFVVPRGVFDAGV